MTTTSGPQPAPPDPAALATSSLRIGPHGLDAPFVQAALSGYSDLAMRRIARRHGASYALNEVVLDALVTGKGKLRRKILAVADDDHPVGGQLMGSHPDDFGPAAAAMAEAGYDVIDVNFGCPVKKVLGRCRGGYLLSQPETALDILRRVHQAVGATHPVTVKMRRGFDDSRGSERSFFAILDGALALPVAAVTVHGRTVVQRYDGPSRWSFLERVKRFAGSAVVLGSGDLFSAVDCLRMMESTGVDGVSIARGAIGNPWIFEECRALLRGEELPPPPSVHRQRAVLEAHLLELTQLHGAEPAGRLIRKFAIKYAAHHPEAETVRDAFIAVRRPEEIPAVLARWYDAAVDWPVPPRRPTHGDLA